MGRDRANKTDSDWKKHQTKKKWHAIVAVFISVTLMFAVLNGLAKGFSFKNNLSSSIWDGKSSFTIAIGSDNPALFIFQPDLKNLVVFTISEKSLYETGDGKQPFKSIEAAIKRGGVDYANALTKTYESKIDNYIINTRRQYIDDESAKKYFLQFASITTPIKLLTNGWNNNIADTNITRIDALKLWWQAKGLSVEEVIVTDLSLLEEEIILGDRRKVLGADTEALSRYISKYLENTYIRNENLGIKIVNNSGSQYSLKLASAFIANIGGSLSSIEDLDSKSPKTKIIATDKNTYTARNLANIFNCDINEAKTSDSQDEIVLILGEDFTARYYE